ncbi:hypothetical protein ABNB59_20660 [Paenibacillus larvae]|uniref:Uncharacterized protein n=1 Tax=Paenibacillus larvae TaxID=1464 RepID=A0AAP5JVC2_9BACL|nr:hypothetical protein [Paenibacillus larvae]UYE92091.1 hypothetical protein LUNBUN_67 [Paenibacillus phage LunBun]UYE92173.1 hypothetical protein BARRYFOSTERBENICIO_67 [Paenibacillus phage BarryFoster_Benicio]UYL91537.1 hypothetical protein ABATENZ_67 [Paenibacillus phage ABAtENZ]UYL91619.1 hypothetical protein AJG77_67 [Paenibacillus phage AJG77]UYL91701.1 hypothetical protein APIWELLBEING_67 [Paenibacillus phage ApiWellbeing]UYL91783.1 hypothetical protein BLOOMFIELD_67 [Paenibacillus pha
MIYGIIDGSVLIETYETPEEAYEAAKVAYEATGDFFGVIAVSNNAKGIADNA